MTARSPSLDAGLKNYSMASNAASPTVKVSQSTVRASGPQIRPFWDMTKSNALVFRKKARELMLSPAVVLAICGIFVYSSVVFWIEARFARSPSREVA